MFVRYKVGYLAKLTARLAHHVKCWIVHVEENEEIGLIAFAAFLLS